MSKINIYYIISYLSSLLAMIFFYASYRHLSGKKFKFNFKNTFLTLISVLLILINNLLFQPFAKTILSFLILLMHFKLIFKEEIKKTFIITFFIHILGIIIDIIMSLILAKSGIISGNITSNFILIIKCYMTTFNTIIIFLIVRINYIKNIINKLIKMSSDNKEYNFIVATILLITICLLGAINIIKIDSNSINNIMLILVILFSIILIIGYRIKYDKTVLKIKVNTLKSKNILYNAIVEEYRELKHNLIDQLDDIRRVASGNVKKQIEERINDIKISNTFITNLEKVPDGIKDIFYIKFSDTKDININIVSKVKNNILEKNKS